MAAWEPSQKGLFLEAPQRQRVTRLRTSYSNPSAETTGMPPRSQMGPEHCCAGSSTRPMETGSEGSMARPVCLSIATRRPEGQLPVWRMKRSRDGVFAGVLDLAPDLAVGIADSARRRRGFRRR